jgi:signal transduction histidine kinase/CheY-like chemotaxis protein
MLHSRPLTELETKDLQIISLDDMERMKSRLFLVTVLGGILTLIYPLKIIIIWYLAVIIVELWGLKTQWKIEHSITNNHPISTQFRMYYFIVSWLETLCFAALFIALSAYEGQVPHFIPYLIILCTSFYIATSSYHNAILMFGHLGFNILALIYVATRDVWVTYPETQNPIWVQFLISLLVVYFLIDIFLFFHNIHLERHAKSIQLDKALRRAEKLTQQKSDLISAIGHELRTPLNGILGFSQMIKRTKLSKQQADYVNLIEGAGKDLQLLLSNVQDNETLEQGRFHLHPVNTDIPALLVRILKAFELTASDKGIYLKLDVDDGFPDDILIDDIRLGQCISNLVSNAVHYTLTGGVTVTARFTNGDRPKLAISVADTGVGIPEGQTGVIFEKFSQGNNQKITQSGTGLGLWLVRSITQAMNGTLSLAGTSDKGSEFLLEFNLGLQDYKQFFYEPGLEKKRILHIEDTPTNLILVRLILGEQGIILSEAKTGKEALEMLNNNEFDAVLCDFHLPDYDGNRLLADIRKLNNTAAEIPVIALTAQPEKISKSPQSMGFAAILPKPINRQRLVSTLSQILAKPG